jgi:hypothetical protein
VDAVSSEPVSGLNSLVTGRFTGNFVPQEPSCADQTARKCLPIGPFSAFGSCPRQNRAGNFQTGIRELSGGDQGTCYREQGSRLVGSDDALLEKPLETRNDLKNRVALVDQLPGRRGLAPPPLGAVLLDRISRVHVIFHDSFRETACVMKDDIRQRFQQSGRGWTL